MEDYIGYDLDPVTPEDPATAFRPSTRYEAMAQAGAQAVAERVRAELDGPRQDSQRAGGERPVR